ncbi:hypothetical protein BO94DRAFT_541397 [Aspergillus sclerotioniger CBS 115572]|uniref:Uncharacterized protein n=1 Tax=Aspergillus sclerotioniger CBS 115572 TaxID=1450535 RepID=A0A317XFL6_9EURO|nr:hypothetical protein BO94DRAFT_541397 [Aspergillus sclerotioniger CBS 115572]PWY96597.1 hypothetical protein BO94DRAFT_541397 [Aspergillus sclerotioniger CBS 115572]
MSALFTYPRYLSVSISMHGYKLASILGVAWSSIHQDGYSVTRYLSLRSASNGESQTDWRGMAAWVFGQCLDRTGARPGLHHAIACQITLPVPPCVIRAQGAVRRTFLVELIVLEGVIGPWTKSSAPDPKVVTWPSQQFAPTVHALIVPALVCIADASLS